MVLFYGAEREKKERYCVGIETNEKQKKRDSILEREERRERERERDLFELQTNTHASSTERDLLSDQIGPD